MTGLQIWLAAGVFAVVVVMVPLVWSWLRQQTPAGPAELRAGDMAQLDE